MTGCDGHSHDHEHAEPDDTREVRVQTFCRVLNMKYCIFILILLCLQTTHVLIYVTITSLHLQISLNVHLPAQVSWFTYDMHNIYKSFFLANNN